MSPSEVTAASVRVTWALSFEVTEIAARERSLPAAFSFMRVRRVTTRVNLVHVGFPRDDCVAQLVRASHLATHASTCPFIDIGAPIANELCALLAERWARSFRGSLGECSDAKLHAVHEPQIRSRQIAREPRRPFIRDRWGGCPDAGF